MKARQQPCDECPFRRDTEPGQFPRERYEALRSTVGRAGREQPIGAPFFGCHKTPEGKELACAGWLAVCGYEHLGVRLAISRGQIDPAVLQPGDDWPELHESYGDVARVQGA